MNIAALRKRLKHLEEAASAKRTRQSVSFWDLLTHAVAMPDFDPDMVLPMKDGVPIDLWDFVSGAVEADNMAREDIQNWDRLGPWLQQAAYLADGPDPIEEAIYAPLPEVSALSDRTPVCWAGQALTPLRAQHQRHVPMPEVRPTSRKPGKIQEFLRR